MKLSKRQFLAALAGAAVAPTLLLPRKSRAQDMAPPARAKQLLIIYAGGGMRSHALFSFPGAPRSLNPYGVEGAAGSATAEFRLAAPVGGNPDTTPFQLTPQNLPAWGRDMPSLFGSTHDRFSLIGPVDHNPGGPAVLDRKTAINLISTGRAEGGAGLLTIIGNAFASSRPLPPFAIGDPAQPFASPARGLEAGQPVFIRDPLRIGQNDDPLAVVANARNYGALDAWELDLRRKLDGELKAKLPPILGHNVELVARGREQMRAVQEVLARPQLWFNNEDTALAAFETSQGFPITNRRLEQAFLPFIRFQSGGQTPNSDFTDPLGAKMAMAVRLLQYGSPAVAVGYDGFDLHKNEDRLLHTASRPLGRAIAGLLFVLGGMPGSEGKTRLDETLIVVVSEWGRDGTSEETGYNETRGSDTRGGPANRYQVLPIFGAGIKGGRLIGGYSKSADLTPTGPTFSTPQLAATMLDALGVDFRNHFAAEPIEQVFG